MEAGIAPPRGRRGHLSWDSALELSGPVIDAAARGIEEKKRDLLANVHASVAVDPAISVDDALLYPRRIRAASWRQLVALRCGPRGSQRPIGDRQE
jgi:hypothetical protein